MQYYVNPNTVQVEANSRSSKSLKQILERDGQIVPILVTNNDGVFTAVGFRNGDRVICLREMGWETILIEDEWTEDDL